MRAASNFRANLARLALRAPADLLEQAAMAGASDLYFELEDVLTGSDAITLLYTNHRGQNAAETFIFDEDGEICIAVATYG